MENQITPSVKSSETPTPRNTETPKKKQSFFFVLGRNPELSRQEVLAFLKARNRAHEEILFEENLLIIKVNEGERFDIQEFGGVIHLGPITLEGNIEELEKYLKLHEVIPSDKFSYAIHGNADTQILKEKFKSEHKKASQKHGKKLLKFQDGHKAQNPKGDFHILFHEHSVPTIDHQPSTIDSTSEKLFFGLATQSYDSNPVKKRDMEKPVRREALAISPRLSKILINLSGAKPYDKLLDPFCGIGGILAEALIKKINVYGIDKERQAADDANQNLRWLSQEYEILTKYKVENNDSRRAPDLQFQAIATETPLGKILRKKPSDNQAKQIIQNFEAYMVPILKRLKKVKKSSAKIAITFPVIRNFHVDAQKMAERSGLRIHLQPILESRKDQFISRDILVLK
jgi:tRNA G10  N-methylase Trm11